MDAETKQAVTEEFDRMISMMGVGELRAEIHGQGKLLQEVRDDLKHRPLVDLRRCEEQQQDIDNVKTALFGHYDQPGGMTSRVSRLEDSVPEKLGPRLTSLEERMRLLIYLTGGVFGTTVLIVGYTVVDFIAKHVH